MAHQHEEVELKFRVPSGEALQAVGRAAGGCPQPTVLQVNHFFDTAHGDLQRQGVLLRLRDEDGRFILTAKGPAQGRTSSVLARRVEDEVEVPADLARRVVAGEAPLLALLEAPGVDPGQGLLDLVKVMAAERQLVCLGCFRNQRTRWPARLPLRMRSVDVVLELDCTTFPGNQVDFEVEVEVPDGVPAEQVETAVRLLLRAAGLPGEPAPSKSRRFFAALAAQKP